MTSHSEPEIQPTRKVLFFCEHSHRGGASGTWSLLGIFTGINTRLLPLSVPSLGIFVRVDIPEAEPLPAEMAVDLMAPDGKKLIETSSSITYSDKANRRIEIGLNILDIELPAEGEYTASISFDGKLAVRDGFKVAKKS